MDETPRTDQEIRDLRVSIERMQIDLRRLEAIRARELLEIANEYRPGVGDVARLIGYLQEKL